MLFLGTLAPITKNLINLIILAAKSFIFKPSRSNGQLSEPTFGSFVKKIYLSQEYVSKLKDEQTLTETGEALSLLLHSKLN